MPAAIIAALAAAIAANGDKNEADYINLTDLSNTFVRIMCLVMTIPTTGIFCWLGCISYKQATTMSWSVTGSWIMTFMSFIVMTFLLCVSGVIIKRLIQSLICKLCKKEGKQ